MTDTLSARTTVMSESIDDILRRIGHEYARLEPYHFRDHNGMGNEDESVRHLVAETGIDVDIGRLKLNPVVLPHLDGAGEIHTETTSG